MEAIELANLTSILSAIVSDAMANGIFVFDPTDIKQANILLDSLGLVDNAHDTLHALQLVKTCHESVGMLLTTSFLLGYKCRKDSEMCRELDSIGIQTRSS